MTTDYPEPLHRPTNTLAIVAIIASFVLPLVGIVLGFIARRQISRSGEGGAALATAAIVVGFVVTALALAIVGAAVAILVGSGQLVGVS